MNFTTKKIIKGRFNDHTEIGKMYVIVDPVRSKVVLMRYGLVEDLTNFSDWVVKRKFKNKYLIYQSSAFKLQTLERLYDIIDTTLEFYNNHRNFLKKH